MNRSISIVIFSLMSLSMAEHFQCGEASNRPDIRNLSHHFLQPTDDISPWMFYPQSNIAKLSTKDHRGLLSIADAGKGEDIKGTLKDPIRIDSYNLPWEFRMALLQPEPKSADAQNNYAFGVNLVVTFSDPSEWPSNRTQIPLNSRSMQLFVVRLGAYGEMSRRGVPQLRYSPLNYYDPSPEVYLVYGRGDLSPNVVGDWKIPYNWVGYQVPEPGQLGAAANWSWGKFGGPAADNSLQDVRFRVRVISPTQLEVGFGSGYKVGWRMRTIDTSNFGKITGIWEIGPIISLDRWLADQLAADLDIFPVPQLEPPKPASDYFFDYLDFFGNGPADFEHMSDEFNIPGIPADEKWFVEGDSLTETWSNPGYLTVTFSGKKGAWAMCPALDGQTTEGLAYIEMEKFKPPLELEIAFIAPDDSFCWNFWHSFGFTDEQGKGHSWSPGIQNIPDKGRFYINQHGVDPYKIEKNPEIDIVFEKEIPQSILTHEPVRILLQIIDTSHIRVGLKGEESDPWLMSKVFDTAQFNWKIKKFQLPCPVSFMAQDGSGVGNYPQHQKFLIDYVRYRYGLSE